MDLTRLSNFGFLLCCLATTMAQQGNDRTLQQFAAFVGASDRARQAGDSFQVLRFDGVKAFADETGVCEIKDFKCDPTSPYRTDDGSCNNLRHPTWGKSVIPMRRYLPPAYDDGKSTPRTKGKYGWDLPSARFISTTVHGTYGISEIPRLTDISHMVMQWGQFTDHDITHSPMITQSGRKPVQIDCCAVGNSFPCFPIPIPPNDPFFRNKPCFNFIRSVQVPNAECTMEPVEQMNSLTSFVDSSNVYGSGDREDLRLYDDGLLKFTDFNLLPTQPGPPGACDAPCFDAGDLRVNEQMVLTSIQTLLMREHNRIARTLKKYNTHWEDERLFQESRKIVGAIAQKITYYDWLVIVLDPKSREEYDLEFENTGDSYNDVYDPDVDPSIRNGFSAAAFRFGHSLVRSAFTRLNPNFSFNRFHFTSDIFGKTSIIRNSSGRAVDQFMRGLLVDQAGKVDRFITPELTNLLFKSGNNSLDLAALNIQRGRDHGIPPYNAWREWCNLPRAESFHHGDDGFTDHSQDTVRQLALAYYGLSPDDVDLFPAGISEKPLAGGLLGPTFACIVAHQFWVIRSGDRFWYELDRPGTGFSEGQLRELQKANLGRIICDNTNTFYIQENVFKGISKKNPQQSCTAIPKVDLRQWQEFHSW